MYDSVLYYNYSGRGGGRECWTESERWRNYSRWHHGNKRFDPLSSLLLLSLSLSHLRKSGQNLAVPPLMLRNKNCVSRHSESVLPPLPLPSLLISSLLTPLTHTHTLHTYIMLTYLYASFWFWQTAIFSSPSSCWRSGQLNWMPDPWQRREATRWYIIHTQHTLDPIDNRGSN